MKKLFIILLLSIIIPAIAQQKMENLKVNWPEEYKWKIGNNQEDKTIHFMELIPEKETLENWSIIGTMMSLKNVQKMPMDKAVELFYNQTKKSAPNAKLTVLDKKEQIENPWVLFKVEVDKYLDDPNPESQVYYVIQGNSSLFVNIVGIKQKIISQEFEEKWGKIFKSSELIYQ